MPRLDCSTQTLARELERTDHLPDVVRLVYRLAYHGHVACVRCYNRCRFVPCVLFPVEVVRAMRTGFGSKLALEQMSCENTIVDVIAVATRGHEAGMARLAREDHRHVRGACCLLAWNRALRCQIRDAWGVRPIVGRVRACTLYTDTNEGTEARSKLKQWETAQLTAIATFLWTRPYGRSVLIEWKERYLYGRSDESIAT